MEKESLLRSSSSKKLPQGMLVEMTGDDGPTLAAEDGTALGLGLELLAV